MRSYFTRLLSLVLVALLATVPLGAVSPAGLLNSTTLSGAIDATQTTLVLASASASTGSTFGAPSAGQCLFIDQELMTIVSMSSTTATVRRGTARRSTHANSAVILTGPCSQFKVVDPPNVGGNADCSLVVLPWANTVTGDTWWCDNVTAVWSVTNPVARNGTAGSRRVAQ